MKTVEIQLAITACKHAVKEWHDEQTPDAWKNFCVAMDNIVRATIATIPPTIQIQPVEVIKEVMVVTERSVEVSVPVEVIREVVKLVETTQETLAPSAHVEE